MVTPAIKKKEGKQIELLAPAGNIEAGYAALHYGADAVYLGLGSFSARAAAINFSIDELADITGYAHSLPVRRKIYVAVNTLVLEKELGELVDLLAVISGLGVDAVIVQDLGVLRILRRYFSGLKVHASTQMAIHNLYGVEAAEKMGLGRVTLARELTLDEIAGIAAKAGIEIEVFVHGALCYSYSGLCLFSSHLYGRSGNRGKCAYPCREWFKPDIPGHGGNSIGKESGFIFSMKDLALPDYVAGLKRIGITALKIEGRMKNPLYVAAVTNYYRLLIDGRLSPGKERELAGEVRTIFSRPWTDLYLRSNRNRRVVDTETQGHRGCPAGKVEEIGKCPGGHCLRFRTTLPVELHDGLQIDIAGQPRPFGFAVKNINLIESGDSSGRKRVFATPAGARVEIQLPRGHPRIPLGAVIYSSSSQKVKQQYDFFQPKRGQFRSRQTADFELQVEKNGFDVLALADVSSGIKSGNIRLETRKHYAGLFQPAKNAGQVDLGIATAFGKLGDTNLKLGKLTIINPHNLFIPVSRLNSARREISAVLEREIAGLRRKQAEDIKAEALSETGDAGHGKTTRGPAKSCKAVRAKNQDFNWSIKTDQAHLLAGLVPDDWRDIDEIIIECLPGDAPGYFGELERLSGLVGKSRLRLSLPVIMREWEIKSFAKNIPDLIAGGWRKWQVSNLGGWEFLANVQKGGLTWIFRPIGRFTR